MSDTHTPGASPNLPPSGAQPDPFGDEAMRLFAAMQQRIEAIKQREAASTQREQELATRLRALETRAAELASIDARLAARDAETARRQADIERVQSELFARLEKAREAEAIIAAREAQTAAEQQRLTETIQTQQADMQAREKALAEQRDAQRAVMTSLEARSAELERIGSQISAREAGVAELEASYQMAREAAMREAEESRTASAKLAGELQTRAMLLAQVKADLDARQTQVQGQWSEVEARIAQLARFKQELDARQSASEARDVEARASLDDAERLRAAAAESEARAAQAQQEAQRTLAAMSAELRSTQAELARVSDMAMQSARSADDLAAQRTMLEVSATEATERARIAESRVLAIEAELADLRSRPPEVRIERVVERVGPTEAEVASTIASAVAQARAETSDQVTSQWVERLRLAQDATADAEQRAQRMEATAAESAARLASANDQIKRATESYEQRSSQMATKLFDAESRLAELLDAKDAAESQWQDRLSQAQAQADAQAAQTAALRAQVDQSQADLRAATQALDALKSQPPIVKIEPDPAALARIDQLQSELAQSRAELQTMTAEAARVRSISEKLGLEARRISIEAAEQAETQAAQIAALRADLATRPPASLKQEADELRRALQAAREGVASSVRQRGEIESRAEMLATSIRETAEADRAALLAQINDLQASLAGQTEQHAAATADLNQRAAKAESEQLRLASMLDAARSSLDEATAANQAMIATLQSTVRDLEQRASDATSRALASEAEQQEARRQIAELTARLATPMPDPALLAERDQLAQRVSELEAERARAISLQSASESTLRELVASSEASVLAARERQSQAEQQVQSLRSSLDAQSQEHAALARRAAELQAEAEARRETDANREAAVLTLQERVASLEGMLAQATSEAASHRAAAQMQTPDTDEVIGRLKEALQQRESSLRNLSGRLAEMERELRARTAQPATAPTGVSPEQDRAADLRRHRLTRYRSALRERMGKIETAYNAIRQKESMLDRVVEQRVNSALAAAALVPKPIAEVAPVTVIAPPTQPMLVPAPTVDPSRRTLAFASNAAAAAVVALAVTGLSFLMIKPFMGFTYAAQAVIKANTGNRVPEGSEMTLWNSRHKKLLESSKTYQDTAKKFGDQRVDHLASLDFVQRYFGSRLTVDSTVPGELTLRLRGDTPSEAENALRTYVETVVSAANATRLLQGNEYSTDVAAKPQAVPDPITGSTTMQWSISSVLGFCFAAVFWFVCHRFRESSGQNQSVEVNPGLPEGFLREPAGVKPGWAASGAAVKASVASIKGLGKHLTKGGSGGKKAA